MRGHVRKRGKGWVYVVDAGDEPARRCAMECARVLVWADDPHDTCPRCAGPLTEPESTRRQRWSKQYPRKTDAEAGLRRALGRLDDGDDAIPETVLVRNLARQWFDHMAANDKPRPRTRLRYAQLLTPALEMIGGMEVRKVKPLHIQAVLDASTARGLAPRTVQQQRAALSSMYQYALRGGIVVVNVVRGTTTPTPQRPALVVPTPEQLDALAAAAIGSTWEVPTLLATVTGMRRSEILGVRWRHVEFDAGTLRVVETLQRIEGALRFVPPKTERARREIPLPPGVVARLRAHKAAQAARRLRLGGEWQDLDLVCDRGDGGPHAPDAFTHGFGRIAAGIGLDGMRLHDCRHGVATMLAKRLKRAELTSMLLGHSSVAFTKDVYTHPDEEDRESIRRALSGA